jgi:hypothetical protein
MFLSFSLKPGTVRAILGEAEHRCADGTLESFVEGDLADVLTWLQLESPVLDHNQVRRGWRYLARQAGAWKAAAQAQAALHAYRWTSLFQQTTLGGWTVEPITDAWQLHQEARAMRHCASQYLEACMDNRHRLFSIRNAFGKRVATLGLARQCREWETLEISGFANRPVGKDLRSAGREVQLRYNHLWRLHLTAGYDAPDGLNQEWRLFSVCLMLDGWCLRWDYGSDHDLLDARKRNPWTCCFA